MEHVNSSSPVNSTLGNDSCCDIQDVPQTFFITTYGLVFLLGLVLNGITVRVYFCQAQRRPSSVTVYLKNLVVADFLLSLCIPLRIANYASRSVMRRVYCSFGASAFYLNMYASILFMDYIAANMYASRNSFSQINFSMHAHWYCSSCLRNKPWLFRLFKLDILGSRALLDLKLYWGTGPYSYPFFFFLACCTMHY